MTYAHSIPGLNPDGWEPLADHLLAVSARASSYAHIFGSGDVARIAGLLHDLGKAKPEFQAYLRGECGSEPHSGEGARFACERFGGLGKLIAYCIAGHHAGLANGHGRSNGRPVTPLSERVKQAKQLDLPAGVTLSSPNGVPSPLQDVPVDEYANFRMHFFVRMIFSSLVDADFLETEAFYDRVEDRARERGWSGGLDDIAQALDSYLASFGPPDGQINEHRAEILSHVRSGAVQAPGLFTLTVPTGGGKTLASLAFALDHARRHGLRRVIYVVPYTSIIEQTARVFREALGDADAVLEHHASFDWEGLNDPGESERLRLAAQNWDRPIIVTTAVQFFESLYSNRPAACRKLHNLARSVMVLDEAQMLPLRLLRPCLAALKELVRGYGGSVVLCTATQPALLKGADGDGFPGPEGLEPENVRELAPDPLALYDAFRRVQIKKEGILDDEGLAERLIDASQVLAILNNRSHARALFDRLRGQEGAALLTTFMTPAHRRAVLKEVRTRLQDGAPVRLVATSLIEAGVDVDFPQVWREAAGIDSIAQAAGRCNREGRLAEGGRLFIFRTAENFRPPADLEQFARIGEEVLSRHDDPLSPQAVRDYFRQIYWDRGQEALDAVEVGRRRGILKALSESGNQLDFPFADIAAAFRMIPDGGLPLIVRGGHWGIPDMDWQTLLHLPHAGSIARTVQPFAVQVPRRVRAELIRLGAASWVRPADFGEQFAVLENDRLYDNAAGFSAENPEDLGGMIL